MENAGVQRATLGAAALKKAMRDPDSFQLESVEVQNNLTVCYGYRSRNGFGGMSKGYAVFLADLEGVMTSERGGRFQKSWNKECLAEGKDVSAAVKIFASLE